MMIRSAPPFSMNFAEMPVPAPAAMIGWPFFNVASRRSTTSWRVYGFPFPVQGLGIGQMFVLEKAGGTLNGFAELGNFGLAHFEILNFTARLYLAAMADLGKLLAELIALPSVNPAFVPEGTPGTGEQLVADYLTALGGKVGLAIELQEVFPGRHNVIARLEPRGKRKQRVLLGPHMDTVVAAPEQFRPMKKNGRVYGRGACDTKGSVG